MNDDRVQKADSRTAEDTSGPNGSRKSTANSRTKDLLFGIRLHLDGYWQQQHRTTWRSTSRTFTSPSWWARYKPKCAVQCLTSNFPLEIKLSYSVKNFGNDPRSKILCIYGWQSIVWLHLEFWISKGRRCRPRTLRGALGSRQTGKQLEQQRRVVLVEQRSVINEATTSFDFLF